MAGGGGKGGGGTSTVNVNNSGTTVMDILGLDDQQIELILPQPFKSESKTELVLPQPFKSESRTELAVTEPIRTESDNTMALDIKPVAVDLCLNLKLGELPPTRIRQPYQQHFGITLFGLEVLGFNVSGESQIVIQDYPKKPQIAWGGEEHVHHEGKHEAQAASAVPEAGGLRIRLGP